MARRRAVRSPPNQRRVEPPPMNSFSPSDAALDGFQVIRTQWRVALGWCLFSLVGFVGLVILAFFAILAATLAVTSREQAGTAGSVVGGLVLGLGGAAI